MEGSLPGGWVPWEDVVGGGEGVEMQDGVVGGCPIVVEEGAYYEAQHTVLAGQTWDHVIRFSKALQK